jgi:hypothetical protein
VVDGHATFPRNLDPLQKPPCEHAQASALPAAWSKSRITLTFRFPQSHPSVPFHIPGIRRKLGIEQHLGEGCLGETSHDSMSLGFSSFWGISEPSDLQGDDVGPKEGLNAGDV